MQLQTFFTLYAISVPLFFILDMLWIGFIAKKFYIEQIGYLMGDVRWIAAISFYLIFILGLTLFASYPAATKGTVLTAIVMGALFGFFTYATYDLTNLATVRSWPLRVTFIDIAWGTVLGASVSGLAVLIRNIMV